MILANRSAVDEAQNQSRRPVWLWPHHVLRGAVTRLIGDVGIGSSTIALDIAARMTAGRPLPDGTPNAAERVNVLIVAYRPKGGDRCVLTVLNSGCDLPFQIVDGQIAGKVEWSPLTPAPLEFQGRGATAFRGADA